jgi:hypothetical protein
MGAQIEQPANGTAVKATPKSNRGWFRPADSRINREGRPHGSKAAASLDDTPDRAWQADRVKRLCISERDVAWRLTHQNGPWAINLPNDFQIVECRIDSEWGQVVFVIRSQSFPRIAKGTLIPIFKTQYNGLKWRRLEDRMG